MTNKKFDQLFGGPRENPKVILRRREINLASSIQAVTEEIVLRMAKIHQGRLSGRKIFVYLVVSLKLCCKWKITCDQKIFDKIWIQPASGDAGGAIGLPFLPIS